METEFAFRHHNSDPERAAAVYESIKVNRLCVWRVSSQVLLFNCITAVCLLQCLKAEDVASAVTYVLSAPAHVQVSPQQTYTLPVRNVSWAANQHIRMISKGSCDTEDWSNDAENSALHYRNKLHFTIYSNIQVILHTNNIVCKI